MPPIDRPSLNWPLVSQWWFSTGCLAQEGDHGVGAAEGEQARLQALEEDRRRQGHGDRTRGDGEERRRTDGEAIRPVGPPAPVRPQLVGDAAGEQDDDEGEADPDRGAEAEAGDDEPKPTDRPGKWIELAGKLSEDQLQILRKEVTGSLAGRTGDLGLLDKQPEPEREIAEIAALARLAFWLCRSKIEAPDPIAEEIIIRLADSSRELNEYEELRERYEVGKAEEDAPRRLRDPSVRGESPGGGPA
jgi:hypothetical protein